MKSLLKIMVVVGAVAVAGWGYPSSVAAFPMSCGTIPSCSAEQGKACKTSIVCCTAGRPLEECPCVSGHYHCIL
jgi:hypothetical protein